MAQALAVEAEDWYRPAGRNPLLGFARFLRRNPLGAVGLGILVVVAIAAVFAPLIAPYDPNAPGSELLQAPSWDHLFGTDRTGRDVFSRVVYGARPSLAVGLGSVALGAAIGLVLGLSSGFFAGWLDVAIQRFADIVQAFPLIVLVLLLVNTVGQGVDKTIILLGLAIWPGITRLVRASVLSEREREYVTAARAMGVGSPRIMVRHLLPNVAAPVMVWATTAVAGVMLAGASLSFLGFGIPLTTPSWGGDLSGSSRNFFTFAPWMAIFPGLALALTVLGFNFFGDAVRDAMDPRLRGERPKA
jgi:peptide/nickel transport system permease protein